MSKGATVDDEGVETEKGLEGVDPSRRRFVGGGRSREIRDLSSESDRELGGDADGVMKVGRVVACLIREAFSSPFMSVAET